MVNIRIQKKNVIEAIIIYSLLFLVSIWLLQGKNNYHIDEMFSYGLANHREGIVMPAPEEGKLFEPVEEAYYNYLTVSDRLNFKNVWLNQEIDVHPPLYYSILHTICSFFPGQFSIWFAGYFSVIFIAMALFAIALNIYAYVDTSKRLNVNWAWIWFILYIPFIAYFALVSQMAVYTDARYMSPNMQKWIVFLSMIIIGQYNHHMGK